MRVRFSYKRGKIMLDKIFVEYAENALFLWTFFAEKREKI